MRSLPSAAGLNLAVSSSLFSLLLFLLSPLPVLLTHHQVVHEMDWTPDGVKDYNSTNPLEVEIGDLLHLICPSEGPYMYSNLVVQFHQDQYDQCNCSTSSLVACRPYLRNAFCAPPIRSVVINIKENPADLASVINYHPGNQYYLISYSLGENLANALSTSNIFAGGQCWDGLRLSIKVVSHATTSIATTSTTTASTKLPSPTSRPGDRATYTTSYGEGSSETPEANAGTTAMPVNKSSENITPIQILKYFIGAFVGLLTLVLLLTVLILIMVILRRRGLYRVRQSGSEKGGEGGGKDSRPMKFVESGGTKENIYVTGKECNIQYHQDASLPSTFKNLPSLT